MPIDHFGLRCPEGKIDQLVSFLINSLEHTGFREFARPIPTVVGMGDRFPYLWISTPEKGLDARTVDSMLSRQHMAFVAETREQVDQFYAAALKAGGTCNGPPGDRKGFDGNSYYAAFVRDPAMGNNFEMAYRTVS